MTANFRFTLSDRDNFLNRLILSLKIGCGKNVININSIYIE